MSNVAKFYYDQYRDYLAGLESMTPEQQALKIIEMWPAASSMKYLWPVDMKVASPDKILARGYGICHDQARVHAYLAKNNHVKYESIVLIDKNHPEPSWSHSATFWFANKEVYHPSTTNPNRKMLFKTKESNYEPLINTWIAQRYIFHIAHSTIDQMTKGVSNSYQRFFEKIKEKMSQAEEADPVVYKVNLLDSKIDNMNYDKFMSYVQDKYKPYEIKDDTLIKDEDYITVI